MRRVTAVGAPKPGLKSLAAGVPLLGLPMGRDHTDLVPAKRHPSCSARISRHRLRHSPQMCTSPANFRVPQCPAVP